MSKYTIGQRVVVLDDGCRRNLIGNVGEDRTVPDITWPLTTRRVRIDTNQCLNLAVAASIVMYDRAAKELHP